MDKDQLVRAATERGISADEAGRFAEILRLAVYADAGERDDPVGQSGGLPRLPVGAAWPTDEDGSPLPFIASFDCVALPHVDGLALPEDGSLLFFLHHEWAYDVDHDEEQANARVVYVPAGTETAHAEEPDHDEVMFNSDREFVGEETALGATVRAEWPEWLEKDENELSEFQLTLARDLPHRIELCAMAGEIWPKGKYADFTIGGFTQGIGELRTEHLYTTPETIMAEEKLADDSQLEEETHRVQKEWLPLLQFEIDEVYVGRFLIRRTDLAAGRFEKAQSFTAFTE